MPNVKSVMKTVKDMKIPFSFPAKDGKSDVFALVDQMDAELSAKQICAVMQEQGCCKDERVTAPFRAFGKTHAGKTLEEKVALLPELESGHRPPCRLNTDGTLSVYWGEKVEGKYRCVCRTANRAPDKNNVSKTFCGCYAGHARNTLQYALGVSLDLKEIVSSPISSGGERECSFVFSVADA